MFWDQEPGKARRGEHVEAKHDRILMISKRRGAGLIAIAVIALFISLDPPRQYFLPGPIALDCLLFFGWCFLSHLGSLGLCRIHPAGQAWQVFWRHTL